MASLIVPKWMRSEFRSDIITRPTNGVKLAPAYNKLRPYAYRAYGINRSARGAKMASK